MRPLAATAAVAMLLVVACSNSSSRPSFADEAPSATPDATAPASVDDPAPTAAPAPTPTELAPEATPEPPPQPPSGELTVEIVGQRPHDPAAFTQGLVLDGSVLYESTGNDTTLRRVDAESGDVLDLVDIDDEFFGEGLELVGDRLIQLTWTTEVAFVYDAATFEQIDTFDYEGEGWGLCLLDDGLLVRSDGSNSLTFHDAETFAATATLAVTLDGVAIGNINELECVGDTVWANIWLTNQIVGIDVATGQVHSTVDATELDSIDPADGGDGSVLNGIAYSPATDTFLLTGKRWSTMFEVRFVPVS